MPQIKSYDDLLLHYEIDHIETPKAIAVIVHGFGDHCGRYLEFAQTLNTWGLTCYRFDYRGHGRAEGKRGHVMNFQDYLNDLAAIRTLVVEEYPELPRFLLAHSNGGLIALHSLAESSKEWTAAVLSSPFFGIQVKVPLWKRLLGKGLSKLLPTFQMPIDLDGRTVSHDPKVIEQYDTDPLIGRVASTRWFTEVLAAHTRSIQLAQKITLPILIQAAGSDQIVSLDATREVFKSIKSPDPTLTVYDDLYHEIWFELNKEPVLNELNRFLTQITHEQKT